MYFRLEKPDITHVPKEEALQMLARDDVRSVIVETLRPYRYWDKVKYLNWPEDVSPEIGWAALKMLRFTVLAPNRTVAAVGVEDGGPFTFLSDLPWVSQLLHEFDMELGGTLPGARAEISDDMRDRLITRGVMEEAIASSQIEGAHTTRKAAKRMLQEGRRPASKDERMILNNYRAMVRIEEEYKHEPLSYDMLMELHATLTEGTMENSNEIGSLRDDEDEPESEKVAVRSNTEDITYHLPPSATFLREDIQRLIRYANDDLQVSDEGGFVHPIIKATIIHFWVGYLHPFADGNGRLARALFYWYLLRKGYWAFAFIPLSSVIKKSQDQYNRSYLYTEQDDRDLTYFIDYNLRKIKQARQDFIEYRDAQMRENSQVARKARETYGFNERQVQLIRYFLQHANESASLQMHMNVNSVSRPTAMRDFHELEAQGFVNKRKRGKQVYYFSTEKLLRVFS